jgi:hypothetical protein
MNRKMMIRTSTSMVRLALSIALLVAVTLICPIGLGTGAGALSGHHYRHQRNHDHGEDRCRPDLPGEVPAAAAIKRIAPGQKDLSTAETIQFSDLAVGDRALVKLDPDAPAGTSQALQIVAIKQSDVAAKSSRRIARTGSATAWAGW